MNDEASTTVDLASAGPTRAAEVARAMSEGMNLLFFYAAPRVLAAVQASGGLDGPAMLGSLRRFLGVSASIRARHVSTGDPGESGGTTRDDIDRLAQLSALVEEIAGDLSAQQIRGEVGPMPAKVVTRAQKALTILGMDAPAGGWETFEGYTLPNPAPRSSA